MVRLRHAETTHDYMDALQLQKANSYFPCCVGRTGCIFFRGRDFGFGFLDFFCESRRLLTVDISAAVSW
jgi:hypothetical protein